MPTALEWIADGSVTTPAAFTAGAAAAGLKAGGALDVGLLVSTPTCATAAVFTRNLVRAAPVLYDQEILGERPGRIRAVAVNARVANACTGVERVAEGLGAAARLLSPAGGADLARAMMTTDTWPKHCAVRFPTPHGVVT